MDETLIEFKDASLGYGPKEILKNLNFRIYQNDFIGIVGPNGAGKTTLLRAILGILKPQKGEVIYKHFSPDSPLRFGYVPQIQTIDEIFPLSVYEIVLMGRYSQMGLIAKPQRLDRDRVFSVLKYLGIEPLANKSYRELSGGLRQRVLLARALVSEPNILVLDEPTNDLDLASERITMDLIKKLHIDKKLTIVMVSHLLNVIINYVEKIAFINSQEFKISDIKEALREENLSEVYGIKIKIGNLEGEKIIMARPDNQ